jgi:hypothetical protein
MYILAIWTSLKKFCLIQLLISLLGHLSFGEFSFLSSLSDV